MTAPPLPGEKSRNRSSWPRIAATFASSVVAVEQVALRRAPGRVADHPGPAADQRDRPAAEALQAEQAEDRHEVADVERVGRTGRSRCSRRSDGRSRAGPRGPASSSWRMPRHSSSVEESARARCRRPRTSPSQRRDVESSGPTGRRRSVRSRPLCYRAATMQTSLARRQRHRRALQRPPARTGRIDRRSDRRRRPRRPAPHHRARSRAPGSSSPWARTTTTQPASPTQGALTNLDFEQQTVIYDRTGKIELARLGDLKRELVTFDQLPARCSTPRPPSRTRLLEQPRLRPGGHRVGRPRHRLRPAARRLDDHPAARPRAAPAAGGVRGHDLRAQGPRDHPVDPPDPGVPGRGGKQQIITAYLNQNFYGNQSYGVKAAAKSYFGKALDGPDARPGRDPGRDPAVADEVRPRAERRRGLPRGRRRGRGCTEVQARRARRHRDRPAPQLHPRPDEDAQHADRRQAHAPPSTRRPRRSRSTSAARRRPTGGRRTSCGRSAGRSARSCARTARTTAPRSTPAATGHHDARLEDAADGREVGLRGGPGTERQEPAADPEQPQDPDGRRGPGSSACAATTSTTRPPRSSTTGPARSSPTSGRPATRRRATRSSSPSSTSWPTAGASPGRRSSRSTTSSASTTRR